MAKNRNESPTPEEGPDQKQLTVSKDASIDFPVEVEALEADPYHVTGEKFHAGTKKAAELEKRGWVKIIGKVATMLFILLSIGLNAQTSVDVPLVNPGNTFDITKLNTATATRDTVTNTGVGYLNTKKINGPGTVTIALVVTKVSGTVGGTITLQGSLDGTNYKAINTSETQTGIATITAADASAAYHWRLSNSPFTYYRVSWTGTGTMVAYLDARILKH